MDASRPQRISALLSKIRKTPNGGHLSAAAQEAFMALEDMDLSDAVEEISALCLSTNKFARYRLLRLLDFNSSASVTGHDRYREIVDSGLHFQPKETRDCAASAWYLAELYDRWGFDVNTPTLEVAIDGAFDACAHLLSRLGYIDPALAHQELAKNLATQNSDAGAILGGNESASNVASFWSNIDLAELAVGIAELLERK